MVEISMKENSELLSSKDIQNDQIFKVRRDTLISPDGSGLNPIGTFDNYNNIFDNNVINGKINEEQKKEIRRLLRNEYGGKNCSIDNYMTLVKSLSERYSIDIYALATFMGEYVIDADGKVFIFTKKMVRSKRNKKLKDPNQILDDDYGKVVINDRSSSRNKNPKRNNITSDTNKGNIKDELAKDEPIKYDLTTGKSTVNEIKQYIEGRVDVIDVKGGKRGDKQEDKEEDKYTYPKETMDPLVKNEQIFGPYGTQWIHDVQVHDILMPDIIKKQQIVGKLLQIKCPDQRTPEWFAMRDGKITASDGGCVLGVNDHEPKYKFILKKVLGSVFKGNKYCYHGKKYENIATMIYEYRLNVSVNNFGLIGHPVYKFLGASPDGIIGLYKHDKKHFTRYVGRMLEVKCPLSRKIELDGDIYDICPIYYWVQVQLQLECCDLDECDFWQCKIVEYNSKVDFVDDTDLKEPFRSKLSKFEKGCAIQLLPKNKMKEVLDLKYWDAVYDHAIFIYPPRVEMSPYDCDVWISEILSNISTDPEYSDYYFDRIFYWRLERSKCLTINRDKEWFAKSLPELEKMWNYVEFFRANKDKQDILLNYINSMKLKMNSKIMKIVGDLYCIPKEGGTQEGADKYNNTIKRILDEIVSNNTSKERLQKEKDERGCNYGKFNNTTYAF